MKIFEFLTLVIKNFTRFHRSLSKITTRSLRSLVLTYFSCLFPVFPGLPAAPGMPCQGEDRKYAAELVTAINKCIFPAAAVAELSNILH